MDTNTERNAREMRQYFDDCAVIVATSGARFDAAMESLGQASRLFLVEHHQRMTAARAAISAASAAFLQELDKKP